MKVFKKILSIILSVSFLSVSTISLSALADGDYCFKNSKGGYAHPECADDELGKVGFYKTADFVDIENLGMKGDEERYAFNFRALDEVFEKKKLISNKSLRNQYNLLKKKCEEPVNIFEGNNILFIIVGSLIGAVTGLFCFKNSKNQDLISQNPQQTPILMDTSPQQKPILMDTSSRQTPIPSRSRAFSSLIRGIIGTVIGAVSTIIGLNIKSENDKQDVCKLNSETLHKLVELNKANEANANMLNMLLFFLEHPEHITFDMVNCVSIPKDNDFFWDQKFAGINYTKEEKELFPQKFKEVAAKIRKNLEENHALDVNINSPYPPYSATPIVLDN